MVSVKKSTVTTVYGAVWFDTKLSPKLFYTYAHTKVYTPVYASDYVMILCVSIYASVAWLPHRFQET